MIIHKAFRYRIYPTPEQEKRMRQWEGSLRWLWNLAHEQRLMGLARSKDEKKYYTFFDQNRELTDLRAEVDWLADVPRNVCSQVLIELDKSWQRCFKKLAYRPRWKSRDRDCLSLCESHPKTWRLEDGFIRFPKVGLIKIIQHRPIEGIGKTATIVREVDQWFVSISCEIEVEIQPSDKPAVAIKFGVTNLVTDSDGYIVANPAFLERNLKRIARLQRRTSRAQDGSNNQKKLFDKLAKIHRKVKRQRSHLLHGISHYYAENYGMVIIEELDIKSLTVTIDGMSKEDTEAITIRNRNILDAGWGIVIDRIKYKLEWAGGKLIEIPKPESYPCSTCGASSPMEEKSDDYYTGNKSFICDFCGYSDDHNINASKVLYSHRNDVSCEPKKQKQKLYVVKREKLPISVEK